MGVLTTWFIRDRFLQSDTKASPYHCCHDEGDRQPPGGQERGQAHSGVVFAAEILNGRFADAEETCMLIAMPGKRWMLISHGYVDEIS